MPAQHPAHRERKAELARQSLALGERRGDLGLALGDLPIAAIDGQRRERRVDLDLRRQVAGLQREVERGAVGLPGLVVVGLGDLEVVAERVQRPHRLARVALARQLDRPLEVLARPLGVADAAEDAAEDSVRAACRGRLTEALGEAQRLLGGVDREHVVAGVHVERGRLLVEPDELDARLPVLEQVDAALVVLDRALAVALVPEAGADLAMQVPDPGQVLLAAVIFERLLPGGDRAVDAAESQGDVAELLGDPRPRLRVEAPLQVQRRLVVALGLGVRVEGRRDVARGLQRLERPLLDPLELAGLEVGGGAEAGGAAVVLGDHRDHALGAVRSSRRDERADLGVAARAHRLRQGRVGDVADQHVLERVLALTGQPAAGGEHDEVLLLQRGERRREVDRARRPGRPTPPRRCGRRPPPPARTRRSARGSESSRAASTEWTVSGRASVSPAPPSMIRFTISSANSGLPPERSAT